MGWGEDFLSNNSNKDQGKQSSNKTQTKDPNAGAFTKAISPTGAFEIPVLGGLLRDIIPPAELAADTAGAAGALVTGQKTYAPQFVSPTVGQMITNPNEPVQNLIGEGAKQGAGLTEVIAAPGQAKGLVSIAKATPDLARIITGKGIWSGMLDAAQNPVDWNSVASRAREAAKYSTKAVRDSLEQAIKNEAPVQNAETKTGQAFTSQAIPDMSSGVTESPVTAPGKGISAKQLITDQPLVEGSPRGNPTINIPSQNSGISNTENDYVKTKLLGDLSQPSVSPSGGASYSGPAAVEKRAALGQSIPKTFWSGQSNLDSAQNKAHAILRDALSNELKFQNPGQFEKLNAQYGLHQGVKQIAPRLGAGAVGLTGAGAIGGWLGQLMQGVKQQP